MPDNQSWPQTEQIDRLLKRLADAQAEAEQIRGRIEQAMRESRADIQPAARVCPKPKE